MGYVPSDAKWFLADLVIEFRIEGDPRNVVHINTVLIRADTAEEAYSKAWDLGKEEECRFENSDRRQVSIRFHGLRNLLVIHDELEHGAELMYTEEIGLPEEEVKLRVASKVSLSVFQEPRPILGPNYMPNSIMTQLVDRLGEDAMNEFMRQRDDRL